MALGHWERLRGGYGSKLEASKYARSCTIQAFARAADCALGCTTKSRSRNDSNGIRLTLSEKET